MLNLILNPNPCFVYCNPFDKTFQRSTVTYTCSVVLLTFFINKTFLRPIWSVALWKYISKFSYSQKITNSKFWIFVIIFNIEVNLCPRLSINKFHVHCFIVPIILFKMCIQYTHFLILQPYIYKLCFPKF